MIDFNAIKGKITGSPLKTSADSAVKKVTDSQFFTFSEKPLDFINKSKLFKIIFFVISIAMAAITLIHPFRILFRVIDLGYFNFGLKYTLAFIFTWLSIVASCWLGFHLWRNRRKKVEDLGASEFVAIPFFAELIKTFGEWLGIMFIIIGAIGGLFSLIFLGDYSGGTLSVILFGVNSNGILSELPFFGVIQGLTSAALELAVILGPVIGIVIIFISRLWAEILSVFAAIANNTKGK